MAVLKVLFNVALIFIVVIADDIEDARNCSRISRHLPINIVEPISYKIDLLVKPYQRYLSGTSKITINVKETTRNISLNSYGMIIEFDHVNIMKIPEVHSEPGELVAKLMLFRQCFEAQISVIIFDKVIRPGTYIFNIAYKSILTVNIGIEHKSYMWDSTDNDWILTNHYAPKAIREIFPCWDDPAIKATFDISIRHPENYTAFSTTLLATDRKQSGGMHLTQFHEIKAIPTHLLSIAVISKMIYSDMKARLHYVYHRFDYVHKVLLRMTCVMLGTAGRFYNSLMSSFKKEIKTDHILLSNAVMKVMARPGVIIYREQDHFYNETYYYSGRIMYLLNLFAHQVGRQWFLGADMHDDWLLREAIPLFYSYLIPSQTWKDQLLMDLFVVKHLQPALNNEVDLGMIQVIDQFNILDEIDGLFHNNLYYNKAASLVRLLYYMFPEEDFNKGIVEYIKTGTNFWTVMQSFNSTQFKEEDSLRKTMDTWLKQKYYPELYIHRDYYNNIATCYYLLTHFKYFTWKIPITSIVQSDLIYYNVAFINLTVNWLSWEAQKLIISNIPRNDFIIVNVEQFGYYRVNYNNQNWRRIYGFLNYNNFTLVPVLNRAQLINDAYYFVINGKLDSTIFFHLIKYLKRETDYLAWYPMLNIFLYMSTYLECSEGVLAKTRFVDILDGLLSNLGYEVVKKSYEEPTKIALRWLGMKWACKIGHVGCRDNATKSLIDHVQSRQKYKHYHEMHLWLKDWVFCTGMMRISIRFWEKIKNESIANSDSELLPYLHCSDDSSVILLHLKLLLTTDFGENLRLNMKDVYRSIIKQNGKKYDVIFYVLNNYEQIKTRFNLNDIEILSELIMNSYFTEHLNMIEQFIENKHSFWNASVICAIKTVISARRKQLAKVLDKFKYL